jgi:hypothetical protein
MPSTPFEIYAVPKTVPLVKMVLLTAVLLSVYLLAGD